MKEKCFWVLLFLFILGIFPVFPIIFPPQPKVKKIEVSLEYIDSPYYPTDSPVIGISYTVFDGTDAILFTGITDATGMITFAILASYNQGGAKGIHIQFMWQGELYSINNLVSGSYVEELTPFISDIDFYWEGGIPLGSQSVQVYFEGVFLNNMNLNVGNMNNYKMMVGTYTFKCVEFEDVVFVVTADSPLNIQEEFTVIAKFKLISSFCVFFLLSMLL